MSESISLVGTAEDVETFGAQLTYLYNLDPRVYVLGSIGRLAIDAEYDGYIGPLEVRKPEPREELAFNRKDSDPSQRPWWRKKPTPPPHVLWRDIDVVAPFADDFYSVYDDPSLVGIPIDLHLDGFFRTIDGQPHWRSSDRDVIALGEAALRPFDRSLNGFPVRTFSAAVQEWMEVQFANRYRIVSRDAEPSYRGFAELMKKMRANPEDYRDELELPAELTPQ